MKRVVITGMGIVSSIGNNTQEVLASLREARPGISFAESYAELGFRCQVHGAHAPLPREDLDESVGVHDPGRGDRDQALPVMYRGEVAEVAPHVLERRVPRLDARPLDRLPDATIEHA